MKKEIILNGIPYVFYFSEELNLWRVIESDKIISSHTIDLEIDLNNLKKNIDWNEIDSFISFLKSHNEKIIENIKDAEEVLLNLFKIIYKKSFTKEIKSNISFRLSGIDYKSYCRIINMEKDFEYDFFFFPYNSKNEYQDIGSFVWRANFRNLLLLGVYCDRI